MGLSRSSSGMLSYFKTTPPPYEESEELRLRKQGFDLLKIGLASRDRGIVIHGLSFLLKSLGPLSSAEKQQLLGPLGHAPPTGSAGERVEDTVEELIRSLLLVARTATPYVVGVIDCIVSSSRGVLSSEHGKGVTRVASGILRGVLRGIQNGLR